MLFLPTATLLLLASQAKCTTAVRARTWLLNTGNYVLNRSVVPRAIAVATMAIWLEEAACRLQGQDAGLDVQYRTGHITGTSQEELQEREASGKSCRAATSKCSW